MVQELDNLLKGIGVIIAAIYRFLQFFGLILFSFRTTAFPVCTFNNPAFVPG
jgi:hypothetical protein